MTSLAEARSKVSTLCIIIKKTWHKMEEVVHLISKRSTTKAAGNGHVGGRVVKIMFKLMLHHPLNPSYTPNLCAKVLAGKIVATILKILRIIFLPKNQ